MPTIAARTRRSCLCLLLAGWTASAGQAEQLRLVSVTTGAPRQIGVGDPLRRPVLDALRPTVERDLGQPVRFLVDRMRVQQGWAFVVARPRTPSGNGIDFRRTRHAERVEAGIFDGDTLYALLKREGGGWSVRDYVIGPTDVTYAGWPDDHGAPATLFGLPRQGLMPENQPQDDDDGNRDADQPQQ